MDACLSSRPTLNPRMTRRCLLHRWAVRLPVSGFGDGEKWDAAESEEDPRAALGGKWWGSCRCTCDVTLRELFSSGTWAGPLISPHNISPQSPIGEGQLLNLRSGESCVLSISSAVWGGHPAEHQTEILHQLDSQQDNANPSRLTVFKAYCIMGYELIVLCNDTISPANPTSFRYQGSSGWLENPEQNPRSPSASDPDPAGFHCS